MHWVHLICMAVLIATGFYISLAFVPGWMRSARWLHLSAGFVILVNLLARVYWALIGRSASIKHRTRLDRDWRNFGPQPRNRGQLLPMIRYYLFLKREHPATGKYNPIQKITYVFWGALLLFQGWTGSILHWSNTRFWGSQASIFGNLMDVRTTHFMTMWVFIVTVMVHVYLALAEDWAGYRMMFFRLGAGRK